MSFLDRRGLLTGAAFAIFAFGYGPIRFLRGTAISITADAMEHAITAKAIIDQGWHWNIERLSAPFTLPFVMLQFDGLLTTLIMKAMAPFFSDPYALITWFFAATFALSAVAAAYVLRDFGQDWEVSFAFGLAFAFAASTTMSRAASARVAIFASISCTA